MATEEMTNLNSETTIDPHLRPGYRKVGLINGAMIGLALAFGAWGLQMFDLIRLPAPLAYASPIVGTLILTLLGGLTGWLTSKLDWGWLTLILWTLTAVIASVVVGYQPTIGRSLIVWLRDPRFWGLSIYPYDSGNLLGIILGGLFVILVVFTLALLQSARLDSAQRELHDNGTMSKRTWWIILAPLPIVAVAGWATAAMLLDPAVSALNVVYDAIETTRDYEGDLFALGLERGANYAAIRPVQGQLTENYTLKIGQIDPDSSMAFVLADFDNGAWINCRTINDQLSLCYDASPPYTTGLASLISGEPVPEDCLGCLPRVEEETTDWLSEQALGDDPQVKRLAHWGSYVLMGVTSAAGGQALECWFDTMIPVHLEHCERINP